MIKEHLKSYYFIVQNFDGKKYSNKIYEPTEVEDIKCFVKGLVGNILVYLYHNDNSYVDLTDKLGKFENGIDISK